MNPNARRVAAHQTRTATLSEKTYHYALLFVLFLIPAFPMPKDPFGYVSPAVFCALTYLLALKFLLGKRRFFWSQFAGTILVLYLIILLSDLSVALRISSFDETRFFFGRLIAFLVFLLFLGTDSRRGSNVLKPLLDVFCWSVFILAILILLESLRVISVGNETEYGRLYFGMRLPFRKATGLPMSDGKLGTILVPALLLLLLDNLTGLFRFSFRKIRFALILIGIVLSQSRSTWLGLAITLALSPFLLPHFRHKKLLFLLEILLLLLLLYTGSIERVFYGLMSEGIYQQTIFNRISSYRLAFDYFLCSPLLGVGHSEVYHLFRGKEMVIHNLFLDNLASTGIIGTLPLLLLFLVYFWQASRNYSHCIAARNDRDGLLSAWLILTMVHVFIELSLYRGFYNEYVQIYFSFLAILTYRLRVESKCVANSSDRLRRKHFSRNSSKDQVIIS